jgi:hypothetical protein
MVAAGRLADAAIPSLPGTLRSNAINVTNTPGGMTIDQHVEHWQHELADADQVQWDTIAVVYQAMNTRITGLETKAIGMFAAGAVIAAGDLVACTGCLSAAVAGLVGLAYTLFALAACCLAILPRPTGGIAEMAAVARMLEPVNIRVSNLVTSAIFDTIRAATVTALALIIFVIWRG